MESIEPGRSHDIGALTDQGFNEQTISHGLPFCGTEVRPKGVQTMVNSRRWIFSVSGQTPPLYLSVGEYGFHRIVGEACLPLAWRELDCPTRRMHAEAL